MNDGFQVSCMAAMPQMGMEPRQWLAALFGMGWSNGFLDDCGWYIYSISMVYHVAPKKAPTCWNLIFGGFALQGLSYIFPSPWACPRVACMPLYANVNGENAHEQWHFGGCFTHFSDQLTRRYVLFHPSEGLFQNMFMRIWIWINPLIIPEGLFQRRFVYR